MNIEHAQAIPMPTILKRVSEEVVGFDGSRYDNNIDLVQGYLKFTGEDHNIPDILRWIENIVMNDKYKNVSIGSPQKISNWKILKSEPITNLALLRYIEQRGISINIAKRLLSEVYVKNTALNQKYVALGFKNDDNGHHLVNPFMNCFSGSKNITFIRGKGDKRNGVYIFKDFFDYLTYQTIKKGRNHDDDVIILNSKSSIVHVYPYLKNYNYRRIYSWLPNDKNGLVILNELKEFLKTIPDLQHKPLNKIYKRRKDFNSWHRYNLNLIS